MKKEVAFLRQRADECEAQGIEQFKRSASHSTPGYTEFGNARDWGQQARFYRAAARELEKRFSS